MHATHRDEAWFESTYRANEHAVRSYVYRRVGIDQVDDIVAEVFATLWRRRDDPPLRVLPWLYGVAANHVAHASRTQARGEQLTQKLITRHLGESYVNDDIAEAASLLDALDHADAELLRLAYWEELSPREIAVVLGISAGAARVRLHRARRRAASCLESEIKPTGLLDESDIEQTPYPSGSEQSTTEASPDDTGRSACADQSTHNHAKRHSKSRSPLSEVATADSTSADGDERTATDDLFTPPTLPRRH